MCFGIRRERSCACRFSMSSKITGLLYLENNLAPGVFTPSRIAILKLLALQAAISLENTYLYSDLTEAEKALSTSERKLRLTIDTIPALVWSTRTDGSLEFVNQHYVDYVGMPAEQVQDWGWTAAVHPDDLTELMATWRDVLASGKRGEAEARFRKSDGEYRWLLARVNPLHDADGNIVKWYGLNTDIEDRKRAEIHLARQKQVLEMIASGRPLQEILAALCRFFEEAIPEGFCAIHSIDWTGRTFQHVVAPSLPANSVDLVGAASIGLGGPLPVGSTSKSSRLTADEIKSDQPWMPGQLLEHGLTVVWSAPIYSGDGSVIGRVSICQKSAGQPLLRRDEVIANVTHLASIAIERTLAEAALRRSETFLTEGQRISLTGSFSWRVDTDELMFSPQLKRIFEFEPDAEVTFETISERVHTDDLPLMAKKMAEVRAGNDNPEYEVRLRMPGGRVKYVRVFARVIRHDDERLECLGAVQDVTQRRLAEEARDKVRAELAHVSRVVSLGALTASIAHEVNQPLASIVTNGETGLRWLSRAEPNLKKVQVLIERVVADAYRAAEIIDRTRSMASRGRTTKTDIALNQVVAELMMFLQHEVQLRNVAVSLDLVSNLPIVIGDRTQLQQVIVNLALNAIQALTASAESERALLVRTCQSDAVTICCIVEDSGPGIDSEHLPQLFDSFFTTKETGMGLGLPIARSIIEAHNGQISADNQSSLGGARFVIELPSARFRVAEADLRCHWCS